MKHRIYILTILAFEFILNVKAQNTSLQKIPQPIDRNCEQYREREEAWANSNDLEVCDRKSTPYTECVCQTARDWVEYRKERESILNLSVQFRKKDGNLDAPAKLWNGQRYEKNSCL